MSKQLIEYCKRYMWVLFLDWHSTLPEFFVLPSSESHIERISPHFLPYKREAEVVVYHQITTRKHMKKKMYEKRTLANTWENQDVCLDFQQIATAKPGTIFVTYGLSPWDPKWIVREKWFGQ